MEVQILGFIFTVLNPVRIHNTYSGPGWNLTSHRLSLGQSEICLRHQTPNISLVQVQGHASILVRCIVCHLHRLCEGDCPADVNRGSPVLSRPLFSLLYQCRKGHRPVNLLDSPVFTRTCAMILRGCLFSEVFNRIVLEVLSISLETKISVLLTPF